MSKVEPALTPEEWTNWIDTGDLQAPLEQHGEVSHALAALGLYGQPFGFTRNDLYLLWSIASSHEIGTYFDDGEPAALKDLAARIAALLPPDEGNPT